jgi:hypothetical protein
LVVISAAGAADDAAVVLDWPYGRFAADDDVLTEAADVPEEGDAALVELLLLLPQPAIATASAIGMAAATSAFGIGSSHLLDSSHLGGTPQLGDSFPLARNGKWGSARLPRLPLVDDQRLQPK